MVTDSPPEDGSALLMPCTTDLDSHFSFTSCPHPSHGFVCTTIHETQDQDQDDGKNSSSVYPSPPPSASQSKRNVPLPTAAARYNQHQFGGILDSPVVHMKAPTPAHTPLSPPPTIPTPTHALPPSEDAQHFSSSSSLLLPIEEQHESPRPPPPQLLSPISPEWTPNRAPEDVFAVDDSGDCVLMSQPSAGAYDYNAFTSDVDDDILGNAGAFGRPALRPLDIPMYHKDAIMHEDEEAAGNPGVLLGFPGVMPPHLIAGAGDEATSPFEYEYPPSPSSSRDFASPTSSSSSPSKCSDLDLDDDPELDDVCLDFASSYSPSPLRSFASLPSPDLDDLDLDMDLGPGFGMSPSPPRRSVASLPSFDEEHDFSDYDYDTESSSDDGGGNGDILEPPDLSMSPPPTELDCPPQGEPVPPEVSQVSPHASANALFLDLPSLLAAPAPAAPPPSILDGYPPAALTARLPLSLPQSELDALLAVRARARVALAACAASTLTPTSPSGGPGASGSGGGSIALDLELRRTVPRDAGEPRRRRKRAKELGREVDALVGLKLGLLPPCPSTASVAPDSACPSPLPPTQQKDKPMRREKAGLAIAGLASVPQLVARMILRRRERCVRGLDAGRGRGGAGSSPLRVCCWLEGEDEDEDEEPPPPSPNPAVMEVDVDR